jgi:heptaprenyl diphosphate synthase
MVGDLDRVEMALRNAVQTDDPLLTEIASHLILAGGKRVRPGFAIAAAGTATATATPASHRVVMGAAAVELVHLGSLYHDDVMDEALVRRTVPSVNARWGNLRAILAGDFLLARASEIAAALGTEVAGLLAATIGQLCEGEVRQLSFLFEADRSEDAYFKAIAGKTASLLATACRIGGLVAELPRADTEALTQFGQSYGMAFQIVDDILDVIATEEQLGKPAGIDLLEGNYTLPVLRALQTAAADELRPLLGRELDATTLGEVLVLVRESGGVESALCDARVWADRAESSLAGLPNSVATSALRLAADDLLGRVAAVAG